MQSDLRSLLELSDHKANLLAHDGIDSADSFLAQTNDYLRDILRMDEDEVMELKETLNAQPPTAADYLNRLLLRGRLVSSGIPQLDVLFKTGAISSSDIIEVIGPAASGKTMLLYTIMLNVLAECPETEIQFIDTKGDFHAMKLKRMMDTRGYPENLQKSILKRIHVAGSAKTPASIINALSVIRKAPKTYEKIRMVMIDSITAPFYLYMGIPMYSLGLMSQVAEEMKGLARNNITIFVTNLATYRSTDFFATRRATQSSASSTSQSGSESLSESFILEEFEDSALRDEGMKPALGKFWGNVAYHKVLINFTDNPHRFDLDLDVIHRELSLFRSNIALSTNPKPIQVTDKGIV